MAGNSPELRTPLLACLLVLLGAQAVLAQDPQARPARLAIDTSASLDESVDANGNYATGIILDSVVSISIGGGFEGIVRPFVQRNANTGEWNRQIWIATLRYERPGPVALRLDAGLIPSPIGLANLTLRPHLNPVISQPASLFTALPPLVPRGPRANLIGAVYPYGAMATVSGRHWDARVAVIDTSPLRVRRIFAQTNPPRFANVVVGAGVTPFVGFHLGASMTRGGWLRAGTRPGGTPGVLADHDATVVAIESELSFRYTKLAGEWVRDTAGTDTGNRVASGWFIHGQQTLTPRWFLGGRVEHMSSPAVLLSDVLPQRFNGVEEVLGYRLTPDITLRVGHRARQGFGRPGYDHQAAASIVWWKRWK